MYVEGELISVESQREKWGNEEKEGKERKEE